MPKLRRQFKYDPLLALVVAIGLNELVDHLYNNIPHADFSATLLGFAVVYVAYRTSLATGLLGAAVSLIYIAFNLASGLHPLEYTPQALTSLRELAVIYPVVVIMVTLMRRQDRVTSKRLVQAEERYRSIYENVMEGIYQTTPEGGLVSCNSSLARICGYDSPESLQLAFPDVRLVYIDPQRRAKFLERLERDGEVNDFVSLIRRADGEEIWIRERARVIRDEQGRTLYFQGSVEDITQQELIRRRLRHQEKLTQNLVNSSEDGIMAFDGQMRYIVWNSGMERITGMEAYKVLGRPMHEVSPFMDSSTLFEQHIMRALKGQPTSTGVMRFEVKPTARQGYFEGHFAPIYDEHEQVIGGLGIIHNVTERVQAERVLQLSEERYRSLFSSLQEAIVVTDNERRIVDVNTAFTELFGYTLDEVRGQCAELLYANAADFQVVGQSLARDGGRQVLHQLQFKKRSGQTFPVELSLHHILIANEKVGIVGTIRDVSERRRAERDLTLMQQIALAANEAPSPHSALSEAVRAICVELGWPVGHAYMYDRIHHKLVESGIWYKEGSEGRYDGFMEATMLGSIDHQDALLAPALKRKVHNQTSIEQLQPFNRRQPAQAAGITGGLAVPVVAGQEVVAILEFFTYDQLTLDALTLRLLENIGSQLGRVVERKQADEEIRQSQADLTEAQLMAGMGSWEWNLETNQIKWSDGLLNLHGLDPGSFTGSYEQVESLTHTEDREATRTAIRAAIAAHRPFKVEYRIMRPDGTIKYVEAEGRVELDDSGTPSRAVGTVLDITDHRLSQEILRQSEERFRLLVQEVKDYAIFMLDPHGRVASWNEGAERLKGYHAEEIIGHPFSRFYTEEERTAGRPEHELAMAMNEGKYEGEGWRVRKDGSQYYAQILITALYDAAGKLRGFSKLSHDITERHRLDQMKGDFVSLVSHQLKTPMALIRGYADNMLSGLTGELTEHQRQYLDEMQQIAVKNYHMISDLLNISRLERGVVSVDVRRARLRDIIEQAIKDYRSAVADAGLELKLLVDGNLEVMADRFKMSEAIANVVDNAVKYTPSGGQIRLSSRKRGDQVELQVADSGTGMESADLSRVFERDQFLSGSPKPDSSSGLGLYIAKQFMLLQGGDVEVKSQPGRGTKFTFTIPLAKVRTTTKERS